MTRNLEIALRHLREVFGRLTLWIDALCINQCDDAEKGVQVSMMGEVFSRAQKVIIWVGEATASSDAMMTALNGIDFDDISEAVYEHWKATFKEFEKRPWFTRAWVLQEIVLAREGSSLVCGLQSTSWASFAAVWWDLNKYFARQLGFDGSKSEVTATSVVAKFHRLRKEYVKHSFDFEYLIRFTNDLEASNPRDHVYALRALLHEEQRQFLQVDYTKPTWRVFAEAMQLVLHRTGGAVRFPVWLNFHGGMTPIEGLPTWVHDLTGPRRSNGSTATRSANHAWPAESMSGSDGGKRYLGHAGISHDMRMLSLRCLVVDTVTDTLAFGNTAEVYLHQMADSEAFLSAALGKVTDANAAMPDLKQYASREPIWRIISSNEGVHGGPGPAPDSFKILFWMLSHLDDVKSLRPRLNRIREFQLYTAALDKWIRGRTLLTTAHGLYGMGPPGVKAGDVLCIAFGARYVLILRPSAFHDGTHYRLVGAAYSAGIMDGEIIRDFYDKGWMDAQTVTIE